MTPFSGPEPSLQRILRRFDYDFAGALRSEIVAIAIWASYRVESLRVVFTGASFRKGARFLGKSWPLDQRFQKEVCGRGLATNKPPKNNPGVRGGGVWGRDSEGRLLRLAILSVRPKCSHRCVSLKETPLKPVQSLKHTTKNSTEQTIMRTKWFKHIAI